LRKEYPYDHRYQRSRRLTRSSFADENAYLVHLTAEDRQTIVDAVHKLRERGRLDVPVETLTKDEFAFGSLSAKLDAAYEDVRSGRGFTIMRRCRSTIS